MRVNLLRRGVGVTLAVFLAAAPVLAKDSTEDLKRQIQELQKGQQEILKQLDELRKLVQQGARPAPPRGPNVKDMVFDLGDHLIRGAADAKITLVEFTDYQ